MQMWSYRFSRGGERVNDLLRIRAPEYSQTAEDLTTQITGVHATLEDGFGRTWSSSI